MDLTNYKNIYFIGIGGVSMSGLAIILNSRGYFISGSDSAKNETVLLLEEQNIKVNIGQKSDNINNNIDLVVYSAAISEQNPERKKALDLNIPCISRAELLGKIMEWYDNSICISGTHGKTTTTAMASTIYLDADTDPTITVGGTLPKIGSNVRVGSENYFLAEACEYTNSFHSFYPTIGIIMNIEMDHNDFFTDINDVYKSFNQFAKNVQKTLLVNSDIKDYEKVIDGVTAEVITYGVDSGIYRAKNISYSNRTTFDVYKNGVLLTTIDIELKGLHNVYNALSSFVISVENGISITDATLGLSKYTGINRRFQYKGERDGITVYDDYAHHPSSCQLTLKGIKNLNYNRTICIFQPHTYSRTKGLLDEFAKSFEYADKLILIDIYPARETNDLGISSRLLAALINKHSNNCIYAGSLEEGLTILNKEAKSGDFVVTMGAGNVYTIAEKFLNKE